MDVLLFSDVVPFCQPARRLSTCSCGLRSRCKLTSTSTVQIPDSAAVLVTSKMDIRVCFTLHLLLVARVCNSTRHKGCSMHMRICNRCVHPRARSFSIVNACIRQLNRVSASCAVFNFALFNSAGNLPHAHTLVLATCGC